MHWVVDGQATAFRTLPGAIDAVVEPPGAVGLNVVSSPNTPTVVHCVVDAQAIPCTAEPGTPAGVGVPGDAGSNVTSYPLPSAAVHCVADGHATPANDAYDRLSTYAGVGLPGDAGLNVRTRPLSSAAVHCVADGHAIALSPRPEARAINVGPDHARFVTALAGVWVETSSPAQAIATPSSAAPARVRLTS